MSSAIPGRVGLKIKYPSLILKSLISFIKIKNNVCFFFETYAKFEQALFRGKMGEKQI